MSGVWSASHSGPRAMWSPVQPLKGEGLSQGTSLPPHQQGTSRVHHSYMQEGSWLCKYRTQVTSRVHHLRPRCC